MDGATEGRSGDGVEGGLGCLPAVSIFVGVEERSDGLAEERPGAMAERHEGIQDWSLTDFDQGWGEQAGRCACVEIEQVSADCDAEMLLTLVFECSVRQVGEWEVCCGLLASGSQLWWAKRFAWPWGMIALNKTSRNLGTTQSRILGATEPLAEHASATNGFKSV